MAGNTGLKAIKKKLKSNEKRAFQARRASLPLGRRFLSLKWDKSRARRRSSLKKQKRSKKKPCKGHVSRKASLVQQTRRTQIQKENQRSNEEEVRSKKLRAYDGSSVQKWFLHQPKEEHSLLGQSQ